MIEKERKGMRFTWKEGEVTKKGLNETTCPNPRPSGEGQNRRPEATFIKGQ